jgi:hypothetical protein
MIDGFVSDTPYVVVRSRLVKNPFTAKVLDGRNGELVHSISFGDRHARADSCMCRSRGVLFAFGRGRKLAGIDAIHIVANTWTTLSEHYAFDTAVHPTRPWLAFREIGHSVNGARQMAVLEWTTGKVIFAWPEQLPEAEGRAVAGRAAFAGDRLVVPIGPIPPLGERPRRAYLEVWNLGPPPRLEKVLRPERIGALSGGAACGRVAWDYEDAVARAAEVFDVDLERVLFSSAVARPYLWREPMLHSLDPPVRPPLLSRSGEAVLDGDPPGIWNVETGAPIWSSSEAQHLKPLLDEDAFMIVEEGKPGWLPSSQTVAVHEFDSGAFRFRCYKDDATILDHQNADGSFGVTDKGVVHSPALRADFLFILCQSILALPIVLTWLALRWRRKRERRIEGATP